jgi:hypothetical protein
MPTIPTFTGNVPNRLSSPDTFSADTDYYHSWLPTGVAGMNAVAAAMNLNSTSDTSTTSNTISSGNKTFTVSSGKSFVGGMWLTFADTSLPSTNSIVGQVASYSSTTLVVDVPANGVFGSGTKTAWIISQSSVPSASISAAMIPVTSAASLTAGRVALDVPNNAEAAAMSYSVGNFRNALINGNMAISQEFTSTSTTITAGAGLRYFVDGWYLACTGANITAQQVTTNNKARLVITGAASNTSVILGQRITSADSYSFAGLFATLSLLISSSTLTSVGWGLYYANTKDVFGSIATPTRTAIQTGTLTGITSTEALKSAITSAALSTSANTGLELVFTTGALLASQTLTVTDIQLEKGSISAPVFENTPEATQITRCELIYQRYSGIDGVTGIGSGRQTSTTTSRVTIPMKRMRAAPTVVFTNIIVDIPGTVGVATIASSYAAKTSLMLDVSHAANGSVGQGVVLQAPSGASNAIELISRL